MVFIWRIETGCGRGAYRGGMCYDGNNEVGYSSKYHPGPFEDGIDYEFRRERGLFGFQTIHHARRWFSSIHDLRRWEQKYDARLVVYRREDCTDTQEGKFQMVFNPKEGALKVSFPASRLHDLPIATLTADAIAEFNRLEDEKKNEA